MANELKAKVSVESKAAEASLGRVASGVQGAKAAAAGGAGVWGVYTGAMKAATNAVRGFFSALGVIGAVMGGINMVISLWKNLSDHLRGPAVRAAEEAKKRAEDLKKAEEDAAKAAQERFEQASEAAREYIKALKEAAAQEDALLSKRSRIRSANTAEANANIDRQVATGELNKTAANAQKRMNNLQTRQSDIEDAKRTAEMEVENARQALKAAELAHQTALDEEKSARRARISAEVAFDDYDDDFTYKNGRNVTAKLNDAEYNRLDNAAFDAQERHNEAQGQLADSTAKLEAARAYLAEVSAKTAGNIEVLNAELAANAAEMSAAEAEFEALAAKERAATLESVGKEAAAEANKALDHQAAAGTISQTRANAQKEVNNLQAQLDALEKAKEGEEVGGFQWAPEWIDKALADVSGRLADALEKLDLETEKTSKPAQSETVKPAVDAWTKIGAFVGNANNAGTEVAKRHLQVAQKHLSLAEKTNQRLQQLVTQISKLEGATT